MKLTTVLFDLDGTLLPMDEELFIKVYFKNLAKKLAPLGYESESLTKAIWGGTAAMVKKDGSVNNEQAFWNFFTGIYGEESLSHMPVFEDFYKNEFGEARAVCRPDPLARQTVDFLKEKGLRVAAATNPLFPAIATERRIGWAGLKVSDFELVTTYENSHYCKPNIKYYEEILEKLGVTAEECLMVGNNADEDMIAERLGMRVFLFPECLINKSGQDISRFPQGGFLELMEYIKKEL